MLLGHRLRLFTPAEEIGVRPACRQMGVHHSTYYRWKAKLDRWGIESLRIRERRRPRMPNETGPHLEGRIIDRAHTGRLTKGRVPGEIVFGARKTRTVR